MQVGLVDENDLAYTLSMEKQTQDLIDAGQMCVGGHAGWSCYDGIELVL